MKMKATIGLLLLLTCTVPYSAQAVITTYSLDKEQVCNTIFNNSQVAKFLALREFFQNNPAYVANYNPADYRYCIDLKLGFSLFYKNYYSAQDLSSYYQNCLNMSDAEIAAENESYIRVMSLINNCQL